MAPNRSSDSTISAADRAPGSTRRRSSRHQRIPPREKYCSPSGMWACGWRCTNISRASVGPEAHPASAMMAARQSSAPVQRRRCGAARGGCRPRHVRLLNTGSACWHAAWRTARSGAALRIRGAPHVVQAPPCFSSKHSSQRRSWRSSAASSKRASGSPTTSAMSIWTPAGGSFHSSPSCTTRPSSARR